MNSTKLVIIDTRVEDYHHFVDSLQTGISHVLLDYETDTYSSLLTKINSLSLSSISSVALVSHSVIGTDYQMLSSAPLCTLPDVSIIDSSLSSWSEWKQFWLDIGAPIVDLLGCAIYMDENWKYVLNTLESEMGVNFRASVDDTGSLAVGGNWILESDNVNIKDVYFTDSIEGWMGSLGGFTNHLYSSYTDASNNLYQWGGLSNNAGSVVKNSIPRLVTFFRNLNKRIQKISMGSSHYAFIVTDGLNSVLDTSNGELWMVGSTTNGRLGNGITSGNIMIPQLVPATAVVDLRRECIDVACGNAHTAVIKNGRLYTFGLNTSGQLGDGTVTQRTTPVEVVDASGSSTVKFTSGCTAVACGSNHTMVLNNGTVWCFGQNTNGQLGDNTTVNKRFPVQPIDSTSGSPTLTSGVSLITSGFNSSHSGAIVNSGIWLWGSNTNGSCGDVSSNTNKLTPFQPTTPFQPISVSSGITKLTINSNSTGIIKDGGIWVLGSGLNGILGTGNSNNTAKFIQPTDYSNNPISSGCTDIVMGQANTYVVKNDGIMVAGTNTNGTAFSHLNHGNTLFQYTYMSTVDDTSDNPIQTFTTGNRRVFGGSSATYILQDDNLYTAGNITGLTYLIDTTRPLLADFFNIKKKKIHMFAYGQTHTVALVTDGLNSKLTSSNGEVWVCGYNGNGQLGVNESTSYTTYSFVRPRDSSNNVMFTSGCTYVACAQYSTAVICNGRLYTFGSNLNGRLGHGNTTTNIFVPTEPKDAIGSTTPIFTSGYKQVAFGDNHMLFINNGALYGCGANTSGQVGTGVTSTFPVLVTGFSSGCTFVDAGASHSAVVKNGKVYTFGLNSGGQLGDGTRTNRTSPVEPKDASGSSTVKFTSGCTHVFCNVANTIFIQNRTIWIAGDGSQGRLGDGTDTTKNYPVQPATGPSNIRSIAVGQHHTIYINQNGRLFGFGFNSNGTIISSITSTGLTNKYNSPVDISNIDTSAVRLWNHLQYGIDVSGTVTISASNIPYGASLSTSTLTMTGTFKDTIYNTEVLGTPVFTNPSLKLATGQHTVGYTFVPTDQLTYDSYSGSVPITITKADPSSVSISVSSISYGRTLSQTTICGSFVNRNDSSVISGSITFDISSTKPSVSDTSANWTFTPTDQTNYNILTGSVPITVTKVAPSISLAVSATTISYGQYLSQSTICGSFINSNDSSVVTGTLAFSSPSTKPSVSTTSANWTFTPSDLVNYSVNTGSVPITITKVTPSLSGSISFSSINYGQTLYDTNLQGSFINSNDSSSVAGSTSFDLSSSKPDPSSNMVSYDWTFRPTDMTNYNIQTGSAQVYISKTDPSLISNILSSNVTGNATVLDQNGQEQLINLGELNTHAFIPMGTILGDNRIYAFFENPYDNSVVTGTISFTNPSFRPTLTDTTASWSFTPDDTSRYNIVTGSTPIKVGYILVTDTIFTFAENVNVSFVSTTIYVDVVNFDNNSLILGSALDNSGTNLYSVLIANDTTTSYTPVTVTGTTATNQYVDIPYSISVSNVNSTTPLLLSQVPTPYFESPIKNATTLAVITYKVIDICNNGFITDLSNSPIPIEIDMGLSYANQTLYVSHIDASGSVTSTTAVLSDASGILQYSITKNPTLTVTTQLINSGNNVSIFLPYIFDLSAIGIVFGEYVQSISADYYLEEDVSKSTLTVGLLKSALKYKDDLDLQDSNDLSAQELPAPSQQSLSNIASRLNRIVDVSSLRYWSGSTTYTNSSAQYFTAPLAEHYIQYVASVLFGHPQAQAPIKNDEQILIDLSNCDIGAQFGGSKGLSDLAVRKFIFEQLVNNNQNTNNASGSRFDISDTDPTPSSGYVSFPFEEGDEIVFRVRMSGGLDADTATTFSPQLGTSTTPIDMVNIFGQTQGVTNTNNSLSITPKVWAIKFVIGA